MTMVILVRMTTATNLLLLILMWCPESFPTKFYQPRPTVLCPVNPNWSLKLNDVWLWRTFVNGEHKTLGVSQTTMDEATKPIRVVDSGHSYYMLQVRDIRRFMSNDQLKIGYIDLECVVRRLDSDDDLYVYPIHFGVLRFWDFTQMMMTKTIQEYQSQDQNEVVNTSLSASYNKRNQILQFEILEMDEQEEIQWNLVKLHLMIRHDRLIWYLYGKELIVKPGNFQLWIEYSDGVMEMYLALCPKESLEFNSNCSQLEMVEIGDDMEMVVDPTALPPPPRDCDLTKAEKVLYLGLCILISMSVIFVCYQQRDTIDYKRYFFFLFCCDPQPDWDESELSTEFPSREGLGIRPFHDQIGIAPTLAHQSRSILYRNQDNEGVQESSQKMVTFATDLDKDVGQMEMNTIAATVATTSDKDVQLSPQELTLEEHFNETPTAISIDRSLPIIVDRRIFEELNAVEKGETRNNKEIFHLRCLDGDLVEYDTVDETAQRQRNMETIDEETSFSDSPSAQESSDICRYSRRSLVRQRWTSTLTNLSKISDEDSDDLELDSESTYI